MVSLVLSTWLCQTHTHSPDIVVLVPRHTQHTVQTHTHYILQTTHSPSLCDAIPLRSKFKLCKSDSLYYSHMFYRLRRRQRHRSPSPSPKLFLYANILVLRYFTRFLHCSLLAQACSSCTQHPPSHSPTNAALSHEKFQQKFRVPCAVYVYFLFRSLLFHFITMTATAVAAAVTAFASTTAAAMPRASAQQ